MILIPSIVFVALLICFILFTSLAVEINSSKDNIEVELSLKYFRESKNYPGSSYIEVTFSDKKRILDIRYKTVIADLNDLRDKLKSCEMFKILDQEKRIKNIKTTVFLCDELDCEDKKHSIQTTEKYKDPHQLIHVIETNIETYLYQECITHIVDETAHEFFTT